MVKRHTITGDQLSLVTAIDDRPSINPIRACSLKIVNQFPAGEPTFGHSTHGPRTVSDALPDQDCERTRSTSLPTKPSSRSFRCIGIVPFPSQLDIAAAKVNLIVWRHRIAIAPTAPGSKLLIGAIPAQSPWNAVASEYAMNLGSEAGACCSKR